MSTVLVARKAFLLADQQPLRRSERAYTSETIDLADANVYSGLAEAQKLLGYQGDLQPLRGAREQSGRGFVARRRGHIEGYSAPPVYGAMALYTGVGFFVRSLRVRQTHTGVSPMVAILALVFTMLRCSIAFESRPATREDAPLLLRIPDVAKLLSLSRSRVYEMTQTGELPCVRMGRSVRVPRKALLALVERQMVGAADSDEG